MGSPGSRPLSKDVEAVVRDADHPMIKAAAVAADDHQNQRPAASLAQDLEKCARIALNLGLAKLKGDHEKAEALEADLLGQYGQCDPRWKECADQFNAFYKEAKEIKVYKRWSTQSDFVLNDLSQKCRIAIIGDWGTGQTRAISLLEKVAESKPDLLIHLGDIYYACTKPETDIFFSSCEKAFEAKRARIFTLCGNHDMYSGGGPYQELLQRVGQPASFFCLRNPKWQILAADTGFNDFDPGSQGSIASWVQDGDKGDGYSEMNWHREKFDTAAERRTILLTHHQPFTRNSPIEGNAVNGRLLGQFRPYLADIPLWLWGHEHNQVIYDSFGGIRRGRCVGASAVSTPETENPYDVSEEFRGQALPDLLVKDGKLNLTVDPALGLYNLGYVLLDLDGASGKASYHQFDSTRNTSTLLHAEDL